MISPQLEAAEPQDPLKVHRMLRLLSVFIDAWADHNWALWESALIADGDRNEGWNEDPTKRAMRQWGAKDQHGIYRAAGLTPRQTQIALLHFDRQLDSPEIGRLVGCDAVTARVHIHNIKERLKQLVDSAA